MTEVDWISTVNLMVGGPARVGMTPQQGAVHVRLAGVLPAVRLEARPSDWPFPEVRVIDLSALTRLPQRARLPAQAAPF